MAVRAYEGEREREGGWGILGMLGGRRGEGRSKVKGEAQNNSLLCCDNVRSVGGLHGVAWKGKVMRVLSG